MFMRVMGAVSSSIPLALSTSFAFALAPSITRQALTILQPIKLKYGDAITWADLITLTGDVSIVSMGGPSIGFCAGRQDDESGFDSLELGPTPEQVLLT